VRRRPPSTTPASAGAGIARITTTQLYVQRNRQAKEKAAKVIEDLAAEVEGGPETPSPTKPKTTLV
jgi:hypothetical protein